MRNISKNEKTSENENMKKSMEYWKNVFKKWANERNFQANLEEYKSDVLDRTLSQFYAELRKENRDDHEPKCLKVMQASLERYLKSKAYPKSIIRDGSFLKGYSTLYFDFCSKCSICTIKTYERQKKREKQILTTENCARKAKFRSIRGPEVKRTTFQARDQ